MQLHLYYLLKLAKIDDLIIQIIELVFKLSFMNLEAQKFLIFLKY